MENAVRDLEFMKNQKVHNDLAVTLHYQGKLQQAIQHYNEALKMDPKLPGARDNLN